MKFLVLGLIFNISYAQNVSDPSFRKFEHPNPGCPINSECSKEMGKLLDKWVTQLESSENNSANLTKFKNKYGTPIQILAKKSIYEKHDPILWKSRCKHHNPKNPNNNVLKGYLFLKKMQHSEAVFTPITVFQGTQQTKYLIPYGDQVTLLKSDKLIVLKDYEDNFYKLAITADGSYDFVDIPSATINKALAKKIKEIECPESSEVDEKYFTRQYCQKVLDLDTNQLTTIRFDWACP